jgi:hypothetical protein
LRISGNVPAFFSKHADQLPVIPPVETGEFNQTLCILLRLMWQRVKTIRI